VQVTERTLSLQTAVKLGQTNRVTDRPPLFGVVVKIGKLEHYGRSTDKADAFPYKFSIALSSWPSSALGVVCARLTTGPWCAEDATGTVEVVLWNTMCRRLYDRLRLEDRVCIIGYRIKRAYGKADSIEVAVNAVNPPGQVLVLTGNGAAGCVHTSLCN
jgi:hypothetical protein